MKVMVGRPGTWSGLLLRTGQCASAAASMGVMLSALGFPNYTAFCFLIASMGLQALWSLGLACLDVFAIKMKRDLHNPMLVSLFVVGDWVTATLSLAAACSSAGVTILFARDQPFCGEVSQLSCGKYEISIVLAFITWLLVALSSLITFWLLASA
ncbi:CASP-like protein 5B3 [Ananas comosus]|uniref:CASP-like protein n=2 Tax=Ananas comosus TaxID=4615 RepID=A0A199VS88_ANACO|nr:CASP-like protein 5B3 [Ananas comosus]OAY80067.1 CASP-like protein 5B2 [Ananas comosus]